MVSLWHLNYWNFENRLCLFSLVLGVGGWCLGIVTVCVLERFSRWVCIVLLLMLWICSSCSDNYPNIVDNHVWYIYIWHIYICIYVYMYIHHIYIYIYIYVSERCELLRDVWQIGYDCFQSMMRPTTPSLWCTHYLQRGAAAPCAQSLLRIVYTDFTSSYHVEATWVGCAPLWKLWVVAESPRPWL